MTVHSRLRGPQLGGEGAEQTQQPIILDDIYVMILSFVIFCKQTVEDFKETTEF